MGVFKFVVITYLQEYKLRTELYNCWKRTDKYRPSQLMFY